jgi:hypothetical protein
MCSPAPAVDGVRNPRSRRSDKASFMKKPRTYARHVKIDCPRRTSVHDARQYAGGDSFARKPGQCPCAPPTLTYTHSGFPRNTARSPVVTQERPGIGIQSQLRAFRSLMADSWGSCTDSHFRSTLHHRKPHHRRSPESKRIAFPSTWRNRNAPGWPESPPERLRRAISNSCPVRLVHGAISPLPAFYRF